MLNLRLKRVHSLCRSLYVPSVPGSIKNPHNNSLSWESCCLLSWRGTTLVEIASVVFESNWDCSFHLWQLWHMVVRLKKQHFKKYVLSEILGIALRLSLEWKKYFLIRNKKQSFLMSSFYFYLKHTKGSIRFCSVMFLQVHLIKTLIFRLFLWSEIFKDLFLFLCYFKVHSG